MKWGICATGTIARKFASTIREMAAEGEQLVSVGSRSAQSADAFAAAFGIPRAYGSYEELFADPDTEAVYIATPNSLHYENTKAALEAGRHVLCEKPFTLTAAQAEALYALAREKGLFLMEALWIRHLPLYEKLDALLAEGVLGEITDITCDYGFIASGARRERKFVSRLGGGALLDIGIYTIGFADLVMKEAPDSFTSTVHFSEYGTDDDSRICLQYPGGRSAVCVQTIGRELPRHAHVRGTKGEIFLPDFQAAETMELRLTGQEPEVIDAPFDINGFEYQIREASRCVSAGRCASTRYTPDQSIALMRQLEKIRKDWGMVFSCEEK